MRLKTILMITGGFAIFLLLGWIVGMRLEDTDMDMGSFLSESRTELGSPLKTTDIRSRLSDLGMLTPFEESDLPVLSTRMPEFGGIEAWLNSDPGAQADLRGKVVLIDFWTYSCINCIRTLPYITSWDEKYRDEGLVVIGVHTPEFAFEKRKRNVEKAIKRNGIEYAVGLDNTFTTWRNYSNRYWPSKYLFDGRGRLRYSHFGEGKYQETEEAIRALLHELGEVTTDDYSSFESDVQYRRIGSVETYIGYARQSLLGSPERVARDQVQDYTRVADPVSNKFYLDGSWKIGSEGATLVSGEGQLVYRYTASDVHLVMGAPGGTVRAEIRLDGAPVTEPFRSSDIVEEDGRTYVYIDEERMYTLIDGPGEYKEHLLEILYQSPGVQIYAFTFG